MKESNIILEKTFDFSIQIIRLCKNKQRNVLYNQLLRSGTSIGANIHEAQGAQSRKDFISKVQISLKESYETDYWLRLLKSEEELTNVNIEEIISYNKEIIRILNAILIKSKL